MQRMKLSLACLLCLSWGSAALAQAPLESDLGVATLDDYSGGMSYGGAYFDIRTMTGDGVGYRNGYTQLGAVYPIWMDEDTYIAPNIRLLLTDNSEIGVNAGTIARRYSWERDRIFGAYGYFDSDNSAEGFGYQQFMFGLETLGERWDARFNAYFPTTSDENFLRPLRVGTDPIFFGNSLGFIGQALFQEAVAGVDFEFGGPLTKRTPWLRGYAGAYAYDADANDPVGVRARMEAWISNDLSVGVNVTNDSNFGTNVNAVVDFRFAGWNPTRYFPQWTTRERMMMPVQRNWRVATANTEKDVLIAGKNPDTGNPYFIVHVNQTNPQPGDGTWENPFTELPASAPGADIILVQRDGTLVDPLNGPITLSNNQRLLGEGKAHTADVTVMFAGIMYDQTVILPGIETDGDFPFLTSAGNIVNIASNNEVSAFNLVNAGGFAITNNPVAGSNNFDLSCLNITGNNGGIFLSNATGTGIIRDVNALNNMLGGISIESGATPLNLAVTDVRSSSLPTGTQAFGMRLIADPGTINANITNIELNRNVDGLILQGTNGDLNVVLTDASIDDSVNDGLRITGTNSDIALNISQTTVNRSGAEGIQATTTGGSLSILGRNVTANNSGLDNVNLAMTNTDMAIDFANSQFNSSSGGSGFVLSNTGGSGGGTLVLNNVAGSGNVVDGLRITGDNFTTIDADVSVSAFNNNLRDGMSIITSNSAQVDFDATTISSNGNGRHGLNFNSTSGSILDMTVLLSNMDNNGAVDPTGNGVNGFVDAAFVDLTMFLTTAANSGNHGMGLVAQNSADVTVSVNRGNFQNSGQLNPMGDAVNIVTDTNANLVFQINDTAMNNTTSPDLGTQDDGLFINATGSSTILGQISNSNVPDSLSNNRSNALDLNVSDSATVTLSLFDVTGENSGDDGIRFDVNTLGTLNLVSRGDTFTENSFDNSGQLPFPNATGDGIDGIVRSGGVVNFDLEDTTFRNSAENGFLLDVANPGSEFNGLIVRGDFSDSGRSQLGVGRQDAFNFTVADEGLINLTLVDTPSSNTSLPPAGTQQRSLFADVSTGGDLVFNNTNGDMSNNLLNAIDITVTNLGSTAQLNIVDTAANNSGQDGFLFDVSDFGILAAQFTRSTLDSSGLLGVADDFDAIKGVIDTDGVAILSFADTPVTNAHNDAMQINASNRGILLATFDNSPLDFAGTNNSGDALRLTFESDADGIVTLQNGSTATNAGDDAVFISATGTGTTLTLNAIDSDFSDSGLTATANGGNGIQALVSDDAFVTLNIESTNITNTTPTLPQLRALRFVVETGGTLYGNFEDSIMSDHNLEGILGEVSGAGTADSLAVITLVDSPVDGNESFGAAFDVFDGGDLIFDVSGSPGLASISSNGNTGVFANVTGASSTAGFVFDGVTIDGNGNIVGGDGVSLTAEDTAVISGAFNETSISSNANAGLVVVLDNSSGDFGVGTITNPATGNAFQTGLLDVTIDGNGNEGLLGIVENGSEFDFNMVGTAVGLSSVSGNGTLGTAGDLTDSFDNVRVEATDSDVEVQFVQTNADGATRNGFNFIANESIFLAQLRAGVSASNNTGGNGVRMVAAGASTQAVLYMSDTTADGPLTAAGQFTGTNTFDFNGSDTINTTTDPIDGFPQTGGGVFYQATGIDVAGFRFSGSANNNGNAADPLVTRDIDADGDGDDDGVHVRIDTVNLAAVEITGGGTINNNVDDGIDLELSNIGLLDVVTQPSELTPPSVVIGAAGPGILIEDLTISGNSSGLRLVLDTIDLNNNDIVIRNNDFVGNTSGDGAFVSLETVTNLNDLIFQNNNISGNGTNAASPGHGVNLQLSNSPVNNIRFIGAAPAGAAGAIPQNISGNGMDGIHLVFMNSNVGGMEFDNNTISGNGVANIAGEGSGIHYAVVNPSDVGPVVISNNTIDSNRIDGVRVVNVAPSGGLWDFTFDSNLSISNNLGFGVNFTLPNGLADLNLAMTDNAGINENGLGGVNLALDQNNALTITDFYGNTINANGGPGVRLTADDGSTYTWALGNSAEAVNTFDDNDDAGIAIDVVGTSSGTLTIVNTAVTSTNSIGGGLYGGDGLAVRMNEAAQLNLTVGDAVATNTTFSGNAGDGIGILIDAATQLPNATIQNSTISGNSADGININRQGSGVIDNFTISGNTITGNTGGDGIDITAAFSLLVDEYDINNNLIDGNSQNGIRFSAEGDAQIGTVLTDNVIENNLDDGVFITTTTVSPGDAAIFFSSAAWTGNSFSFNGNGGADAGIDISGIHNILIGVNDGNPLTFSNMINSNTGDGIEVTGSGFLTIVDADISGNVTEGTADGRAGVDINSGGFNQVSISNSRINNNLGDGIEIDNLNTNGSSYTLFDNIISFNGRDGVEYIDSGDGSLSIGGTSTVTSQITDNGTVGTDVSGGRGVDIIVGGNDTTNSTININNTSILRNAQEGVYTILTASNTQRAAANRDVRASVALQSDGTIGSDPFLTLNIGNVGGNIINDNGQPAGNIGGSGLVMRVGTTRGGDGPTFDGGFASAANGGINANVQNNNLFGNFGADVFVQSFVSISNSGTVPAANQWTDQNTAVRNNADDTYNPGGYQSDPLARLDLIFSNNSGEENAGTNVGASYNNTDGTWKSRGQTGVAGSDTATDADNNVNDDNGPFGTGSRVRNAQRLADRDVGPGGSLLPPGFTIGASDSFLFPGLGESTFRVNDQTIANNLFGAGNGFIMDNPVFTSTNPDANGVGAVGGGPFGIDNVPFGWGLLP